MARPYGHPGHLGLVRRRTFLVAGGAALGGMSGPGRATGAGPEPSPPQGVARSTILIWLSGGASHIDTWDMKPDAPAEYRGEFKPIGTSRPGVRLCEHLPLLARQAHHLAVVNSLGHYGRGTGDHHAGYYYNLTGRAPDPTFRRLAQRPHAVARPTGRSSARWSPRAARRTRTCPR